MPATPNDEADGRVASASPPTGAIVSSLSVTPSGALVWTASGGLLRATSDGRTTFYAANASSLAIQASGGTTQVRLWQCPTLRPTHPHLLTLRE